MKKAILYITFIMLYLPPAYAYEIKVDTAIAVSDKFLEEHKGSGTMCLRSNNEQIISRADDFKNLLIADVDEWKKNKGENLIIVLHACGSNNIAKRFSSSPEFKGKNIKFIAPNNKIKIETYTDKSKRSYVKNKKIYKKEGNETKFIRTEEGRWDVYQDGELIGTYDQFAQPGSEEFNYSFK